MLQGSGIERGDDEGVRGPKTAQDPADSGGDGPGPGRAVVGLEVEHDLRAAQSKGQHVFQARDVLARSQFERAQPGSVRARHREVTSGDAPQIWVMAAEGDPVGGCPHVDLDAVRATADGRFDGREGVLRELRSVTTVGDDTHRSMVTA